MAKKRVVIMGAAGRDFHNFNVYFRDNPEYEVVAFTATQIPNIEGRRYPPELAGSLYPEGIPIYSESELINIIKEKKVDEVVFAYSDVSHNYVMDKGCAVIAAGADFKFIGADKSMLKSIKPVISICAIRTGCGKSQTTRKVATILKGMGKKVTVIRHPMPYGDLNKQRVQRFATIEDLDKHDCTIEEREEYEPHINAGIVVYAGVDYQDILREAEKESDIILWDGGNNDLPFFRPDLEIVVVDPHRPGHELLYYPGEANLYRAHIIVINKIDSTTHENIEIVENNIKQKNPNAIIIHADSPIIVDGPEDIKGKRVLVVEDGPTLTHGEMKYGAGIVAARQYGAHEIIDPRPYAVGSIKKTFEKYPHIGTLLPAMGYSRTQMKELEKTINDTPCDLVVVATPIDLGRLLKINKPYKRVRYELQEKESQGLAYIIEQRLFKGEKGNK